MLALFQKKEPISHFVTVTGLVRRSKLLNISTINKDYIKRLMKNCHTINCLPASVSVIAEINKYFL